MKLRGLPGLLLLGFVLMLAVPSSIAFYTDYLWFNQLGYAALFLRKIETQALVFGVAFTVVYLFLFLNLRHARGELNGPPIVLGTGADGQPISVEGKQIAGLALPVSLVVGLSAAFSSARLWQEWLNYLNAVPFGQPDALFGRDVSYYVFELPIYQAVRQQALVVAGLTLVGCGLYYVLSGSFVIETRSSAGFLPKVRLIPAARRHLALLGAMVFALMAWGAWLAMPEMLLTQASATVGFGASYVDVHARLPFLYASAGVLSLGALTALWSGFGRKGWPVLGAIALYIVVSGAGGIYGTLQQRFVVEPSEQEKERTYIEYNIAATRAAYALDNVEERVLSGDATLTADDIISNAGTIENVRLWDHQPLRDTFAQLQEIRTYYDFVQVDNDRYMIDGKYRQVMLSARELNTDAIPTPGWLNEHLTYTHGYGLTLGPVNEVTTEGLPVLFIQDLPPASVVNLEVDEPSIYYGELTRDYVLVRTDQPEFHYPKGEDNEFTYYEGSGGVPLDSLMRRLMFAARFGSTEILATPQITENSRVMFHRQIGERVRLLAPFLTFDSDPYLVISEGRLFWIQDAYTTTDSYPYATPVFWPGGAINYVRNSVKIVIDAFNGSVDFYQAEMNDPLALTIGNIYPGVLKPIAEMPDDLRAHVRYPEDIFRTQAQVFTTYHMDNPLVFYSKEDQWQVPVIDGGRGAVQMQPYYTIMRIPGEQDNEFIQMLPFTPLGKLNLAAWMVARSDGEHYGKLQVFQFPKQKLVFGPAQIVGRINQDQSISQDITLWNQEGSEVNWGTLLVIPIEESLLYIRPLYLQSSGLPELKQVVVAYQNSIEMAATLPLALSRLFGSSISTAMAVDALPAPLSLGPPLPGAPAQPTAGGTSASSVDPRLAELAAEAGLHFDRADEALRDGNLALYAEEIQLARDAVQRMLEIRR